MFTRRHFVAIARILSTIKTSNQKELLVNQFILEFKHSNDRFNTAKFIDACYRKEG